MVIFYLLRDYLFFKQNKSLFRIHQLLPTLTAITIAASKVGLTYPKSEGHEDDSDINWYKYICDFSNLWTFSPEYEAW